MSSPRVEYQRQDVRDLDLPIADTLDSLAVDKGEIDRVSATANVWLGHGIGVFGTVGRGRSRRPDRRGPRLQTCRSSPGASPAPA